MGGVGFDVVPTDCLAAHLHHRLPTATSLQLGFDPADSGAPTRGTQHTMVEGVLDGGAIRRGGIVTRVPTAWRTRRIDFGRGSRHAVTIPWGDVSTAFHSTGIPDIEVYLGVSRLQLLAIRASRILRPLLRVTLVRRAVDWLIDRRPAGPSAETIATSRSLVWGEARDDAGNVVVSRIDAPGTYTITPLTAVAVIERVLAGDLQPGFQTPSRAYGADVILEIDTVVRSDEPR